MAAPLFDIYFSGQVLDGHDLARVKKGVAALFKAKESQVEKLFSGKPTRIKAGVDQDVAVKFRVAFRKAGALVDIAPAGTKPPAKRPQAAVRPAPAKAASAKAAPAKAAPAKAAPAATPAPTLADRDALKSGPEAPEPPPPRALADVELLPPRSGSLEEFAEKEEPLKIDVSDLDVADAGTTLDDTPEEKPIKIDTSDLEAAPANTGSLEEFALEETPVPLPDISDLELDEP